MFENLSAESRAVVVMAQEEARQLNHESVGTEHILLALAKSGGPVVVDALEKNGIDYDQLHDRALSRFGRGALTPEGHIPFGVYARKALKAAIREADDDVVTPVHLLLGLSQVTGSQAVLLLLDLKSTPYDVHKHLRHASSG